MNVFGVVFKRSIGHGAYLPYEADIRSQHMVHREIFTVMEFQYGIITKETYRLPLLSTSGGWVEVSLTQRQQQGIWRCPRYLRGLSPLSWQGMTKR